MRETLTFHEEDHSYWLGERRLPGVTETISRLAPHRDVDEWYLQRGSAVHAAVALSLQGELDPESVDPRIQGRIDSVMQFIRDTALTPVLLETKLVSTRHQFAGTLDFLGKTPSGEHILADWKGSLSSQVELQMGAYFLLLTEAKHTCSQAVAVETHDDGTYRCRWFLAKDLRIAALNFQAFLTTTNWLTRHNFKPNP